MSNVMRILEVFYILDCEGIFFQGKVGGVWISSFNQLMGLFEYGRNS